MSANNAEIVKPGVEAVAPATPTVEAPAKAEATTPVVVPPAESPAEKQDKKVTAAFIAQRRENRELKEKLAKASASVTTPPPAPVVEGQAQPQTPQVIPAPAQEKAVFDIEDESVKAVQELAKDPSVASLPGALIDIMNMVDTDKRLIRLHNVDPKLAFEEGKKMYLATAGISATPPPIPLTNTPSGGMGGSPKENLDALYNELDRHRAGTREWYLVANKINAQLK